MEDRLKKIHSKGHWRVNIHPTRFERSRIPTLTKCREILRNSVVQLRGWDYPHFDYDETTNGEDWIESSCDFQGLIEYWRFYQSGQFIHHFAFREDYELDPNKLSMDVPPSPSGRYLSILSSLYRVTEIYEFAARLASKSVLSPAVEISIKLVGTKERQLFFWNPGRYLRKAYICQIPEMTLTNTYSMPDLLSHANELALDATGWIFERFNWAEVPRGVLSEDQKKLLERRL